MKINLQEIDQTQFMVHPHIIGGKTVYLVQPQHIGTKFSQANKFFRSSVWDHEGNLVSAGFSKFTNWGENPDNFPVPNSLKNTTIVEKLDGSLLIVSKYKGNIILRTRGTVDATALDNGYELEIFREKYLPKLKSFMTPDIINNPEGPDTWDSTWLFEWVSPNNKIVINYGDSPEWYLVGKILHEDYSLASQMALDDLAGWAGFKRPESYTFPSIDDLMKNVEQWKGKEGVVIYSDNDQSLHKIKGLWYLALHRMKEALSSFDKVIDVWFEQNEPSYQKFEEFIVSQFDWELWTQIRGDVSNICDGYKQVDQIIAGMQTFVNETLKPLPNRKEQALKVLSAYGNTNRASFVFKLLDGKSLEKDDRKKLLYQVLKK
jgi:hypothetical protein